VHARAEKQCERGAASWSIESARARARNLPSGTSDYKRRLEKSDGIRRHRCDSRERWIENRQMSGDSRRASDARARYTRDTSHPPKSHRVRSPRLFIESGEREQPAITPLAETNRPSIASKSPLHVRYFTLRPRRARRGLFNVGRCNVNAERYVATCSSQAQWSPPSSARLLKYGEGVILGKLGNSRGAYPPPHALTNDSVAGNAGDARESHQPRA